MRGSGHGYDTAHRRAGTCLRLAAATALAAAAWATAASTTASTTAAAAAPTTTTTAFAAQRIGADVARGCLHRVGLAL